MLESPLAPYLHWVKSRGPVEIDRPPATCSRVRWTICRRQALDLPFRIGAATAARRGHRHYGVPGDRVVTASGCSAANFLAIGALAGPGDTVLMEALLRPDLRRVPAHRRAVRHFERRFEDAHGST
jgi:hypothetical protein